MLLKDESETKELNRSKDTDSGSGVGIVTMVIISLVFLGPFVYIQFRDPINFLINLFLSAVSQKKQ